MGINGGSKCSATIVNAPVAAIMSEIREKNAASAAGQHQNPVVDVDVNWLISNKMKASESMKVRASKVVAIMRFFSDCGLSVKPVADPKKRHHIKRASVKRRTDKVVLASTVRAARHKLNNLNQKNLSNNTRIEELESLKKREQKLKRWLKSLCQRMHP